MSFAEFFQIVQVFAISVIPFTVASYFFHRGQGIAEVIWPATVSAMTAVWGWFAGVPLLLLCFAHRELRKTGAIAEQIRQVAESIESKLDNK